MPFDPIQPARNLASIGDADLLVSMIELAVGVKTSGFGYDDVEAMVREALSRMGPVAVAAAAKATRKPRKAAAADVAPSAADTMKANAKLRRDAAKAPPSMTWPGAFDTGFQDEREYHYPVGNPMRFARITALRAAGYEPLEGGPDGYMTMRGDGLPTVTVGAHGMIYMGASVDAPQMPRADRERLTDIGRA